MGNMTDAFFEYIQQLEIVQEYDEELDDLIWEHTPG